MSLAIGLPRPMKIFLLVSTGPRRKCKLPHPEADHAIVEGKCPECGSENFGAQGKNMRPSEDDQAYEADGYSTCCKKSVGTIRTEMNTLFGVREDNAVLNSRFRVY